MRVLSFDVGIKNMAYCFFDISHNTIKVLDWNVVNLMPEAERETIKCNINVVKKGSKKNNIPDQSHLCGNKAKYTKGQYCFCERHAKKSEYMMPSKKYTTSALNKMKVGDVKKLASSFGIIPSNIKKDVIKQLDEYFKIKLLEPIKKSKKNASNIDLITIGKNIKTEFNKINFELLDKIVIENQISPIANRMKSIQGMLAQYFIMKFENVEIEFLSSSNKLKGFEKEHDMIDSNYKQHKLDAVYHTKRIIENPFFSEWKTHVINHKKIDDLADAFLQGLWYLKNNNIINIA